MILAGIWSSSLHLIAGSVHKKQDEVLEIFLRQGLQKNPKAFRIGLACQSSEFLTRRARACYTHTSLRNLAISKTWMAWTSRAVTTELSQRKCRLVLGWADCGWQATSGRMPMVANSVSEMVRPSAFP
jgi:hypothetical protein